MILLPSYIISASFLHSKRTLLKFGGMRVSTDTFNREEGTVDASSSLEDLLLHVKSLSAVNRRAISAVVSRSPCYNELLYYLPANQLNRCTYCMLRIATYQDSAYELIESWTIALYSFSYKASLAEISAILISTPYSTT